MKKILLLPMMLISIYSYSQNGITNADDFMYKPPTQLMQQALNYKNDIIQNLIAQSVEYYANNDYDSMIVVADKMLGTINNYPSAFYIKSLAYYHKNEILNSYNFAVRQLNTNDDASVNLYNTVRNKYFADIRDSLSKNHFKYVQYSCEHTWVKDSYINFFLGVSLYFQEDYGRAKKAFKQAKNFKETGMYLDAIKNKKKIDNPYAELISQ